MKPELQKLFEGVNGLSTEFLDKVSGLLESKVEAARVIAIQETEAAGHQERLALVEAHQTEIADLKESHIAMVAEKVDSFLNAVVEEWANKNAPGIDAQIKTEAAERFLTGITGVLKEAGVALAVDDDGRLAAMAARLAESERRTNTAESELKQIRESHSTSTREAIIKRVCEGLVDTKKDTVVRLLEGIEFKTESEYESRVRTFRNLVEGKDDFTDKVGKDDEKDLKEAKKKTKKEGDDDNDDDNDDDEDKDKDETGKELQESIQRQIAAMLKG